jgi:hypothetical protein
LIARAQNLVNNPIVSINEEVGNFLSKDFPFQVATPQKSGSRPNLFAGQSIVRNVYKSVTESIDDMFYGPSMLDVVIQSLTTQAAQVAGIVGAGVNDEDLVARAFKAKADARSIPPEAQLLELSTRIPTLEGESIASSFSAPICDLILAVFELDPKNNWLRRQAVVMILQQVLGSTIERSSSFSRKHDHSLTLPIGKSVISSKPTQKRVKSCPLSTLLRRTFGPRDNLIHLGSLKVLKNEPKLGILQTRSYLLSCPVSILSLDIMDIC